MHSSVHLHSWRYAFAARVHLQRWPSASPDLNPIENLWYFFQNEVARREPKTTEDFEQPLEDASACSKYCT